MMYFAMVILLVQAIWLTNGSTVQKRSTQSEISVLRGLVAKIASDTESMKISLNAKIDSKFVSTDSKIDGLSSTMNQRMDVLASVTEGEAQCYPSIDDSFVRYPATDCRVNSIEQNEGISLPLYDCYMKCSVMSICRGFHYNSHTRLCWLKYRCLLDSLTSNHVESDTYIRKAISFFEHRRDLNCPGNDIRSIQNTMQEKCTEQCEGDVNCVAAEVNRVAKVCWLKRKCEESDIVRLVSRDIYFHRERQAIDGFVRKPNDNCPGNNIWTHRVDAKNCAKTCQRKANCVAFVFWKDVGNCELKSVCGTSRHWNGNTITYDKQ